jgi:hypothetical protein
LLSRVFRRADPPAKAGPRATPATPAAPAAPAAARYWITNPYHAVSIVPAPMGACEAVKALAGRRFLSKEAPTMPLPGCTASACRCAYKHHNDRRSTRRRAVDRAGPPTRGPRGDERRHSPGRRSTDGG